MWLAESGEAPWQREGTDAVRKENILTLRTFPGLSELGCYSNR